MKNRIVTIVSMIFLAVLCFGGCGNTELEERNFPLAAAVTLTKENYQMAFGFEQLKDVADEKSEKENNIGTSGGRKRLHGAVFACRWGKSWRDGL